MKNKKMYHYILRPNNAHEKGILSFALNKNADLSYYFERSGGKTTHEEICKWLESCFEGRSRGIRCFTEPIKWTEKSIHVLKDFTDKADLFEIDLTAMQNNGLIEAVYESPSVLTVPQKMLQQQCDEILLQKNGVDEIDFSPVDWSVCDDALGRRFAFVRYYLIVVKGGLIEPKYIKEVQ